MEAPIGAKEKEDVYRQRGDMNPPLGITRRFSCLFGGKMPILNFPKPFPGISSIGIFIIEALKRGFSWDFPPIVDFPRAGYGNR